MTCHVVLQDLQHGRAILVPEGGSLRLGRDSSQNDVVCAEKHISRQHCVLHGEARGVVRVVDSGSTEGTHLNGARIEGEALAEPGAMLTLARDYTLEVIGRVTPPGGVGVAGDVVTPWWLNEDYLLLRAVGKGGMGVVYEAWDRVHDRRCAIKWLRGPSPVGLDRTRRFQRETLLMEVLSEHPEIVAIYASGCSPSGDLFCAMEFVDGAPLDARIKQGLERMDAVALVARTARAVAYAHEHGVIHRDLKPGNVLVNRRGEVRLTDFGIAKALEEDIEITRSGVQLGTPPFMAPEQVVDSKDVGPTTDVYGLGALLYYVLTGRPPVQGTGVRQVLDRALLGLIRAPSKLDPSIDAGLEAICLKALKSDPHLRFQTAAGFADALDAWLRERGAA